MEVAIGVDTSCYTTSTAALDHSGALLADCRIPLQVKPGGKGLSQSEMVFQHVRNLPVVMKELRRAIGMEARIVAVGASWRPRPLEDSYMPAFLAGFGLAEALSAAMNCPVVGISHQENHVLAGMWSVSESFGEPFLAVHVSGGTTEILHVRQCPDRLDLELVGGSRDLHAGQFVDRVGVALGLPFPAGPQLEALAEHCSGAVPELPVSVDGCQISFSGPESHVRRWLAAAPEPATVAAAVQECIAGSLLRAILAAIKQTRSKTVLLVGGVAANRFIRAKLAAELERIGSAMVRWPEPQYSGDNAVGAAWWALRHRVV